MSSEKAVPIKKIAVCIVVFLLAYAAASWLDLTTTLQALTQPGASEGNVYTSGAKAYLPERALLITMAGAVIIGACFLWALLNAGHVSAQWLDHPFRSFQVFYINPWSRRRLDRSPLHMMSYVIAFAVLRILAAANNLTIAKTGTGPLGAMIGVLTHHLPSAAAFWLVVGPLYVLLAMAASPLAAVLTRWLRANSG